MSQLLAYGSPRDASRATSRSPADSRMRLEWSRWLVRSIRVLSCRWVTPRRESWVAATSSPRLVLREVRTAGGRVDGGGVLGGGEHGPDKVLGGEEGCGVGRRRRVVGRLPEPQAAHGDGELGLLVR